MENKPTYEDAVLKEHTIKRQAVKDAGALHELTAMAMNRHDRRRVAKANGIKGIVGSSRPYTAQSKA